MIAGIVAGIVIVARYLAEPPAEFKVTKDIRLPAEEREHKMNMAAFDGMAPKPSFTDKLQSLRPAALALPELPRIPMGQLLPLDPAEILTDQVAALTGPDGAGSGIGLGAGGGGGSAGIETGFSFMGIESKGKRILLIFDVSASVLNKARKSGVSLAKIKEETLSLLQKLPINARFGLIQFTQNFKAFREELLAATDANRAAAKTWIEGEWVDTGSMQASAKVKRNPRGVVGVFELAAQMLPDVIFLISDASFQWKEGGSLGDVPWEEIARLVKGPLQGTEGCVLNFIGFEMKPEDRRKMESVVRRYSRENPRNRIGTSHVLIFEVFQRRAPKCHKSRRDPISRPFVMPERNRLYEEALELYLYPALFLAPKSTLPLANFGRCGGLSIRRRSETGPRSFTGSCCILSRDILREAGPGFHRHTPRILEKSKTMKLKSLCSRLSPQTPRRSFTSRTSTLSTRTRQCSHRRKASRGVALRAGAGVCISSRRSRDPHHKRSTQLERRF